MQFDHPLDWAPDLGEAIERHPLIVSPETLLVDAIALISQAHHRTCSLIESDPWSDLPSKVVLASCILVMQGQELLGIFTERDIVRLTAQSIDMTNMTVAEVMVHPIITLPERSVQDIFAALFLFRRYQIRHLPILDERDRLVGVISHESIRRVMRPANLLRFRRVSDVMTAEVIQAPLTAPIVQLAQLMAKHRVSCVVVTQTNGEEHSKPVGIITERDIVQFQAMQIDLVRTQAQTVMSTPLFLLSPEDSLWTAHQEMQKRRVGRLVVSWNWGLGLGIVTQTSLLRVFDPMEMYGVIENLQQTIQQLQAEKAERLKASQAENPSDRPPKPNQTPDPFSPSP
ncbi:CBS domain-containing protein [Tumidithrix helvetica PCC 7403]|uniref:CBS domain-containing protein n=1 Tax=Tumidithrix helvetica TaxID=3457545 RepID=UPI003CAB0A13